MAETDELKRGVDGSGANRIQHSTLDRPDQKYAAFEELDRPFLMALIDKIVVGDTHIEDGEKVRDVRIVYNFIGEVDSQ